MSAGWGPQHAAGLPGGLSIGRQGGYWWGLAAAAAAALMLLMGRRDATTATVTILATVAIGIGVGIHEANQGRVFASGRWGAFVVIVICAAAGAIAYTAAYYGRRHWPKLAAAQRTRSLKRFEASVAEQAAADGEPPPLTTLPGGFFGVDDAGNPVTANPRGAALVVGPPSSGKTFSCMAATAAWAPGACVSTSIKAEVMVATAAIRARLGTCWWFDPGGAGGEPPPGVQRLRWNPLVDVVNWSAALTVAARLAGPFKPAAGSGGASSDHWIDKAESWLAVLLYAASLGGGLERLAAWCRAPEDCTEEAEAALMEAETLHNDRGAHYAGSVLSGIMATHEKERSSIASTLSRIMKIYNDPAAVDAGDDPNFDPSAFVRSTDTVYITAPRSAQEAYAPLLAGILESLVSAQESRRQAVDMGTETQTAPVTFALDEAANTAPIPIPQLASLAGGQGLHLVVAIQEPNQVRNRWGTAGEGFLTLFPDKLILAGLNDNAWLSTLSSISGEYDRLTTTVNTGSQSSQHRPGLLFNSTTGTAQSGPSVSYQTQRTAQLTNSDISSLPWGRALHFTARGWQLINLHLFDPDNPPGTTAARPAARRTAGRPHIGRGPGWLANRVTSKRVTIAIAAAAGLVFAGIFIIPTLTGEPTEPSNNERARAEFLANNPRSPDQLTDGEQSGPAIWATNGVLLRNFWVATCNSESKRLWAIQPEGSGQRLAAICVSPWWFEQIMAKARAATWTERVAAYAFEDVFGITSTPGRHGDLMIVGIKPGCQNPDDPATAPAAGPLARACIVYPKIPLS